MGSFVTPYSGKHMDTELLLGRLINLIQKQIEECENEDVVVKGWEVAEIIVELLIDLYPEIEDYL